MKKILIAHIGGIGLGSSITMLPRSLRRKGFNVIDMINGNDYDANIEQIVKKAYSEYPDLILIYLYMPPYSYEETQTTIKEIRTREATKNIPILVLTQSETYHDIVSQIDCNGYLALCSEKSTKETIVSRIVNKINELLNID